MKYCNLIFSDHIQVCFPVKSYALNAGKHKSKQNHLLYAQIIEFAHTKSGNLYRIFFFTQFTFKTKTKTRDNKIIEVT